MQTFDITEAELWIDYLTLRVLTYNVIKAPYRYTVQESDTTMLPGAASLFGQ